MANSESSTFERASRVPFGLKWSLLVKFLAPHKDGPLLVVGSGVQPESESTRALGSRELARAALCSRVFRARPPSLGDTLAEQGHGPAR
jgi:hypothetical protein